MRYASRGHNITTFGLLLASALAVLVAGCGSMPNGRQWGEDATLAPGWSRIRQAAVNAVIAPETWLPAAGALAFQVGRADEKVSEWAVRSTPLYGSPQHADRASDRLLYAAGGLWALSGAATPSGDGAGIWMLNKTKGLGTEAAAGAAAYGLVEALKSATDRTRPNGEDDASFPSGHATGAALAQSFTSFHLDAYGWSPAATAGARIGLGAMTAAIAWARVEAGMHYPSDVLAGIAIGHGIGVFATEAFLGPGNPRNAVLLFEPARGGGMAIVRFEY